MFIFCQGKIKTMLPKLFTQDRKNVVTRSVVYYQEKDIAIFAKQQKIPIISCNLCGSKNNFSRFKIKKLIKNLILSSYKIKNNILQSCANVLTSHLMDKGLLYFNLCDMQCNVFDREYNLDNVLF